MVKRDKIIDERNTEYLTTQKEHWKSDGQAFSKKQMWLAMGALFVATFGSSGAFEIIKLLFG